MLSMVSAGGSGSVGSVPACAMAGIDGPSQAKQARMRSGMSSGSATMSAQPAAMALRGMESNCAEVGSCTTVSPPTAFSASSPCVPSDPMPDNTTPTADAPCSRARDENNTFTGSRMPRGSAGCAKCSLPCDRLSSVFGGITYTWSASTRICSLASQTTNAVTRCSNAASMAFCVGFRC